jgi:hypothetical protein
MLNYILPIVSVSNFEKRKGDSAMNVKEFVDRFNLHVAAGQNALDL